LELGFSKKNILVFIFFSLLIFLFYFFDDVKNINPNYKLVILLILIILYLLIDKGSILKELRISSYKSIFYLHQFSIPFTILCFVLFINALNMFDGINLQCASYSLFIFIILFFYTKNFVILFFIVPIIFFLLLNYLNVCFLGNSGSALLSFIISVLIIKIYNFGIFYADDIFLLMCIPGYDLLRLAFVRLLNKKHPFFPDRNHLHHIISKKIGSYFAFFLILFLIVTVNLINMLHVFSTLFTILFSLFLYSAIIFYFKSNK
jgi:UDP-N-acetylmuramyl pentapeptide phosphotransferase/UDP-N-acetylglucosamine-1-phosphate transferase